VQVYKLCWSMAKQNWYASICISFLFVFGENKKMFLSDYTTDSQFPNAWRMQQITT
jgi:hypothetical protein